LVRVSFKPKNHSLEKKGKVFKLIAMRVAAGSFWEYPRMPLSNIAWGAIDGRDATDRIVFSLRGFRGFS
jgi:hypothetical protein